MDLGPYLNEIKDRCIIHGSIDTKEALQLMRDKYEDLLEPIMLGGGLKSVLERSGCFSLDSVGIKCTSCQPFATTLLTAGQPRSPAPVDSASGESINALTSLTPLDSLISAALTMPTSKRNSPANPLTPNASLISNGQSTFQFANPWNANNTFNAIQSPFIVEPNDDLKNHETFELSIGNGKFDIGALQFDIGDDLIENVTKNLENFMIAEAVSSDAKSASAKRKKRKGKNASSAVVGSPCARRKSVDESDTYRALNGQMLQRIVQVSTTFNDFLLKTLTTPKDLNSLLMTLSLKVTKELTALLKLYEAASSKSLADCFGADVKRLQNTVEEIRSKASPLLGMSVTPGGDGRVATSRMSVAMQTDIMSIVSSDGICTDYTVTVPTCRPSLAGDARNGFLPNISANHLQRPQAAPNTSQSRSTANNPIGDHQLENGFDWRPLSSNSFHKGETAQSLLSVDAESGSWSSIVRSGSVSSCQGSPKATLYANVVSNTVGLSDSTWNTIESKKPVLPDADNPEKRKEKFGIIISHLMETLPMNRRIILQAFQHVVSKNEKLHREKAAKIYTKVVNVCRLFSKNQISLQPLQTSDTVDMDECAKYSKLCRFVETKQICFKGPKCTYAHSANDLSPLPRHIACVIAHNCKWKINLCHFGHYLQQ